MLGEIPSGIEGVSIHAPTRGATSLVADATLLSVFQSTHPHGVRLRSTAGFWSALAFQSTHPHGVRQPPSWPRSWIRCFNPRTHTGCDAHAFRLTDVISVSIHAPTRGATIQSRSHHSRHASFNPRTHTGCDLVALETFPVNVPVSIHAPTRGATRTCVS